MTEQIKKIRAAVEIMSTFTDSDWEEFDKAITKISGHKDMEQVVTDMLKRLKVPPHVKGYKYLREAIIWEINNPDNEGITKELYPMLAEKFEDTVSRVERAMHHAIESSYKDDQTEIYKDILGVYHMPANSEFVYGLADYIKIYIM